MKPETKTAKEVFDLCANEYQARFMDLRLYHAGFDLFCNHIKTQNPEILDLGCGPGNITQYLLAERPDFKIMGIDLAPNMVELARKNNPEANFELMDARAVATIGRQYHGIMCGFCLPYLTNDEAINLIGDVSLLMHPKGILYLSTMEDDYKKSGLKASSSGKYQTFIHYHQANYLAEALVANHFEILHLTRQDYPTSDGSKVVDLVIIAAKIP